MEKKNLTYYDKMDIARTEQLRELLKVMPPYFKDYFRAAEASTSAKTRISYAYDLSE